jgi:hypothetical protein
VVCYVKSALWSLGVKTPPDTEDFQLSNNNDNNNNNNNNNNNRVDIRAARKHYVLAGLKINRLAGDGKLSKKRFM